MKAKNSKAMERDSKKPTTCPERLSMVKFWVKITWFSLESSTKAPVTFFTTMGSEGASLRRPIITRWLSPCLKASSRMDFGASFPKYSGNTIVNLTSGCGSDYCESK